MASGYSSVTLPDGAKLAYEIHGSFHLGQSLPIVLICGMSTLRGDWERLSRSLARTRPVLLYDHRGMGNSTLVGDEELTIELMARDLLFLLKKLGWKEVAICGYSMGGVVAQQLLVLPHHPERPTTLPFKTTHLFLVGTRSIVQEVGINYSVPPSSKPRTLAEKQAMARKLIELALDPTWIAANGPRFDYLLRRVLTGISNRPGLVIAKQGAALQKFDFADLLDKLPHDLKVMVIHGDVDQIIPKRCGEDTLKRIPGSRFIEQGDKPGQVPTLAFGHYCYEAWVSDTSRAEISRSNVLRYGEHNAKRAQRLEPIGICDQIAPVSLVGRPQDPFNRDGSAAIRRYACVRNHGRGVSFSAIFTTGIGHQVQINPTTYARMISNSTHSTIVLEDGAQLAYEVLGSHHIKSQEPIVLIGGMSSLRGDWERLAESLAVKRPVLLFDHRGMGDSTLSPGKEEVITMESLARDLLFLLRNLGWGRLSLCGFSMGGVVAQQLLFLPYLSSNPTQLPFHVTHVLLAGTLCSVLRDPRFGLRVDTSVPDRPRTYEEKKKIARPTLEATFDPRWMADSTNTERFDWWLNKMISGRPTHTILMQGRALNRFTFDGLHDKLPKDIQFLVIHGKEDRIVPPYCGEEILQRIPWAKSVKVGQSPGEVPNLDFGHLWFEYFDVQVWHDVVNEFLKEGEAPPGGYIARL